MTDTSNNVLTFKTQHTEEKDDLLEMLKEIDFDDVYIIGKKEDSIFLMANGDYTTSTTIGMLELLKDHVLQESRS